VEILAKINSYPHDWRNGEVVNDSDWETEREVIRVAVNGNDQRITDHKNAIILDHPNGSVTVDKLATSSVTSSKIAPGAITGDKLDATLLTQLTGGSVDISGIQNQVSSNLKLFWGSVE
jgi:FlaG/FlaF family flagellin (archaellin)